jgi:protein-disulfide isomerase
MLHFDCVHKVKHCVGAWVRWVAMTTYVNPRYTGRRARTTAPEEPDKLRQSPVLWSILGALTALSLVALLGWYLMQEPPPPALATPARVTDDGGRQAGLAADGDGPTTVEVYYDFLNRDSRAVEASTRPVLDSLLAQNRIRLVWHPLGFLDSRTEPAGYSTRAANAVACASDAGKLRPFADALFANQPAAGSAGLSDDELMEIAGPVGLNAPSFAACLRDQRYRDWIAVVDSSAALRGVSAPPAIFVNGTRIDRPTPAALMAAVG